MKSTVLASIVRTFVPIVVGAIVAALAKANITGLDDVATELVTVVITTVFYAAVRLAETHVGPAWGWLLGYANAPSYTPAVGDTGDRN